MNHFFIESQAQVEQISESRETLEKSIVSLSEEMEKAERMMSETNKASSNEPQTSKATEDKGAAKDTTSRTEAETNALAFKLAKWDLSPPPPEIGVRSKSAVESAMNQRNLCLVF